LGGKKIQGSQKKKKIIIQKKALLRGPKGALIAFCGEKNKGGGIVKRKKKGTLGGHAGKT